MREFAGFAESGVFCDAKISIIPNGMFGFSAAALRRINFSTGRGMRVRTLPSMGRSHPLQGRPKDSFHWRTSGDCGAVAECLGTRQEWGQPSDPGYIACRRRSCPLTLGNRMKILIMSRAHSRQVSCGAN